MLMVASLLVGESIARTEWFTYGAIWLAVLILIVGGVAEGGTAPYAGELQAISSIRHGCAPVGR